jgi:putative addiction module component (TIGR02574 family)
MPKEAAEILAEALRLPAAARADLADTLLDSLDESVDDDAEQAWLEEIALRVRELDSGEVQLVPWKQFREQLRSRSR